MEALRTVDAVANACWPRLLAAPRHSNTLLRAADPGAAGSEMRARVGDQMFCMLGQTDIGLRIRRKEKLGKPASRGVVVGERLEKIG